MQWPNKISKKEFLLLFSVLLIFPVFIFYAFFSKSFVTSTKADSTQSLPASISFADLNSDSRISISDFTIWLGYYSQFAKYDKYNADGDFNDDRRISISDFRLWLDAYLSYAKGTYTQFGPGDDTTNLCESGDTLTRCLVYADTGTRDYSTAITTIKNKAARDFSTVATTDEGLHATPDYSSVSATTLDGTSYYFRGAVEDNWVSFAGFLWRVVRINGDGSIRLVYSGTTNNHTGAGVQIGVSEYNESNENSTGAGYTYGDNTDSTIKSVVDSWYENNIRNNYEKYLANEIFCNDRSIGETDEDLIYYGAFTRFVSNNATPSLQCVNKADMYTLGTSGSGNVSGIDGAGNNKLKYPVGLLSVDEISFGGCAFTDDKANSYLCPGNDYWLISPLALSSSGVPVMYIASDGYISVALLEEELGVRPVINLKSDVLYSSGNGTVNNPYEIQDGMHNITTPIITLSSTEGTVGIGSTITFIATVSSGVEDSISGTLTVSSSDTTMASVDSTIKNVTATPNGAESTITITGISEGVSTITVGFSPTDITHYADAIGKTYTVTVESGVSEQMATIPTATDYCHTGLVYTGSSQTLTKTEGEGYIFSDNEGTDAGNYTVTATLEDGYIWNDNSTEAKTVICSIEKYAPTITLSAEEETLELGNTTTFTAVVVSSVSSGTAGDLVVESGDSTIATVNPTNASITATPSGIDTVVTVTGVSEGVSTITVGFTPTDTTNNTNATSKTYTVTIGTAVGEQIATIPTATDYCQTGLVYTGSSQTLTKTEGVGYTFSNNEGTDAGDYTVSATLEEGYVWTDSSTEEKTFICSIDKVTPTITLSSDEGTVEEGNEITFVATVTSGGVSELAGTLSVESGDTSIATVDPTSKDITAIVSGTSTTIAITGLVAGSSTITIKFTPDSITNYNSPESKTFDVDVTESTPQELQTPTITLSSTEGTVELGNTASFTATVSSGGTSNIEGTLTVSSGDTNKATVSPESTAVTAIQSGVATTITVAGVAVGSSTITVSFVPTDTTNFNSADNKTYTVTVNAAASVPTLAEKIIMDDQGASSYSGSLLTAIRNKTARDFSTTATTDEGLHATADYASPNATSLNGYSYYFRGAVTDNWVSFAGFLWRIIRINGDGSIRMIYSGTTSNHTGANTQIGTSMFKSDIEEEDSKEKFVGYMFKTTSDNDTDSTIKTVIDTWYENNLLTNYEAYLSDSGFCGDRTVEHTINSDEVVIPTDTHIINYYGGFNRTILNSTPTLKCSNLSRDMYTLKISGESSIAGTSGYGNNALKYPIGLLTADEVAFAGGHPTENNSNYYLYNGQIDWLISPGAYDEYYNVSDNMDVNIKGIISGFNVDLGEYGVRPVINLKSNVKYGSGSGTENDPYVVQLL
ncbi:hypothetical protein J6Z48_02320 [bacterium]|nr:hypothetical protein [bacterium]